MTQRALFQTKVLEKIGAPLITAVAEVAARQGGNAETKAEALRVAELVARTVHLGLGLAGSMDLRSGEDQGDSIRLALTALAGPLVANHYTITGKAPDEAGVKRIVTALEAVLTFADKFTPAADHIMRLDALDTADIDQIHIQYVGALVPVVNAVAAFPFGQPEKKLLQDVTGRLVDKSRALAQSLLGGGADPKTASRAELHLLRALADVYAQCHGAETVRLMAMDDAAMNKEAQAHGGVLPLDPVWRMFETRAAMMEVLGKSVIPTRGAATGTGGGPAVGLGSTANPSPLAAVVEKKTSPLPPPSPPAAANAPPEGNSNPMSFFKPGAKKAEGEGKG